MLFENNILLLSWYFPDQLKSKFREYLDLIFKPTYLILSKQIPDIPNGTSAVFLTHGSCINLGSAETIGYHSIPAWKHNFISFQGCTHSLLKQNGNLYYVSHTTMYTYAPNGALWLMSKAFIQNNKKVIFFCAQLADTRKFI